MLTTLSFSLLKRRAPVACTSYFRNYLSEAYKCAPSWQNRLQPDYMQKIDLDQLYVDIEQSFSQFGKPSAIDIDLFINKLTDNVNPDEVSDLLYKLRLTEETSNALPSTGHAVIRLFLENDFVKDLMEMLDDRLNYGVFLDHYVTNYLLDELIKRKDFTNAARVATLMMLQEDFEDEIGRSLALYACWKYLDDPQPFYAAEEKKEDSKKSKDEVKIRVKFLRNEYFDDHFDLRDNLHLVGKTLSMIGSQMKSTPIGQNAQLLGEILYDKYDKALATLSSIPQPNNFYKDVILQSLKRFETIAEDKITEATQQLKIKLENIANNPTLNQSGFAGDVENLIKDAVTRNEKEEIAKQEHIYKSWMELRESRLQEEINRLNRTKRLREIEKTMESMQLEEQKLWFFENEDKIDLQIDSKKVYYPKRWFGKKKKPKSVDESYVPPEV